MTSKPINPPEISVSPANTDTSKPAVDYYYLEAMRYLSCSDHHESDSDNDCSCRKCRGETNGDSTTSLSSYGDSVDQDLDATGRGRSWSHSQAQEYENGTVSQLPDIDGKAMGPRLRNRRYSDGMLLKPNLKVQMGHVQWADECKKELTRYRPRKKYVRNPTLKPGPVKSILKNASDESLHVSYEEGVSDESEVEDAKDPPV